MKTLTISIVCILTLVACDGRSPFSSAPPLVVSWKDSSAEVKLVITSKSEKNVYAVTISGESSKGDKILTKTVANLLKPNETIDVSILDSVVGDSGAIVYRTATVHVSCDGYKGTVDATIP